MTRKKTPRLPTNKEVVELATKMAADAGKDRPHTDFVYKAREKLILKNKAHDLRVAGEL